jgi:predicted anti-sigma-YlaC factor YlaD
MTGTRPSGHVAHCADCQAYYRTADTLVGQLRQSALKQAQPSPDDLAQRIARAVRQSAPRPVRRRAPALSWSTLAGVSTIAVAALSLFIVRQNPGKPTTQTTVANQQTDLTISSADVTMLVNDVDALRSRLLASVEPTAKTLAEQNPLTQELDSVQADARSALGFLALNFLPSDSAQQFKAQVEPTRS